MNPPIIGSDQFFSLTPDLILRAVEFNGFRCTGRYLALNSMENRVMEVEIEISSEEVRSPSDRFKVVKFYRPGRWSREQINEEHQFLFDLIEGDIPVVAPLKDKSGKTLFELPDLPIYFSIFPKCRGRMPQEFSPEDLVRMGRLIARAHTVGAGRKSLHRMTLNPLTYGDDNLKFLSNSELLTPDVKEVYLSTANRAVDIFRGWFDGISIHRLHGDLHIGNIIWGDPHSTNPGPTLVDFDDMVVGPAVQDLWLVIPGRGEEGRETLSNLLEGYEELRNFERETLRLIEPLRTLRLINYNCWIAKRWDDPSFKAVFPDFGSPRWWREKISDLNEQIEIMHQEPWF